MPPTVSIWKSPWLTAGVNLIHKVAIYRTFAASCHVGVSHSVHFEEAVTNCVGISEDCVEGTEETVNHVGQLFCNTLGTH